MLKAQVSNGRLVGSRLSTSHVKKRLQTAQTQTSHSMFTFIWHLPSTLSLLPCNTFGFPWFERFRIQLHKLKHCILLNNWGPVSIPKATAKACQRSLRPTSKVNMTQGFNFFENHRNDTMFADAQSQKKIFSALTSSTLLLPVTPSFLYITVALVKFKTRSN